MSSNSLISRLSRAFLLGTAACTLSPSGPAFAQRNVEGRVDKLEKEMQAVQRKVFPGGAGQIVAPDVTPQIAPIQQAGSPASSPVADLTQRVNAIESQLTRLTGQVEENGYKLRQLEEAFAKLQAQQAAAAAAVDPTAVPMLPPLATGGVARPAPGGSASAKAMVPPSVKPDAASPQRTQAVAAIERPNSGNAAQDGYTYGYRLWQGKFYPEAEAQLQDTVDKFGSDPVASRAANLLGRAYLDDGKPSMAAKVLFENYRARPKGDRAAESLAWVGEALIQLKRLKDACLAYDELNDVFGASMPANVRDMMTKGRVRAKCGG